MKKVAVIISSYNVEKYIKNCIDSIINQSYKPHEIIVCDDCSTDSTMKIISTYKHFPNVKVIENTRNMGRSIARNKCIELSNSDYIMIQDADDVSEIDRIEKLIAALDDDIDFIGSSCYCFNDKDEVFSSIIPKEKYPARKDLVKGMPFVHASMMFRRNCLISVGGYSDKVYAVRVEDYDLIFRLYSEGYKGMNIQDKLYGYRINKDTITRRTLISRINECIVRCLGYRKNKILFPYGIVYVFKPLMAYLYQYFRYRNIC